MNNMTISHELKERLAALHRFSLAIIQDASLDSLLEHIAIIACHQVGAKLAVVSLLDEHGELECNFTARSEKDNTRQAAQTTDEQVLINTLFQDKKTIRYPQTTNPKFTDLVEKHGGINTLLNVPILQGNLPMGQIFLANKDDLSTYTEDDQKVTETLAAYAATAITNTYLHSSLTQRDRSLARRDDNLALLNKLASTLNSSSEIDQMLDNLLGQIIENLHLGAGEIFLRQEESDLHKLFLHQGDDEIDCFWKQTQFKSGEGIVGKTALSEQPILLDLGKQKDEYLNDCMLNGKYNQLACFPLNGRSGAMGVLCIVPLQPWPLDDLELQFLTIISSWVGTVIENARLNLQQRRLAVLEERERIGMDLHDGIIQSIYAVGLALEHARLLMGEDPKKANERIEQSIRDLDSTIRDLRSYILDLRPHQMHEENLLQGIQRLANEFRLNTLIEVNLQGSMSAVKDLPETHVRALFHICQEALANVAKHAHANQVDVSLWATPDRALLEVRDDGRGFDLSKIKLSIGHGLSNMRIRARNIGGDVEITSEPGQGTTSMAWIPFPKELDKPSLREPSYEPIL